MSPVSHHPHFRFLHKYRLSTPHEGMEMECSIFLTQDAWHSECETMLYSEKNISKANNIDLCGEKVRKQAAD